MRLNGSWMGLTVVGFVFTKLASSSDSRSSATSDDILCLLSLHDVWNDEPSSSSGATTDTLSMCHPVDHGIVSDLMYELELPQLSLQSYRRRMLLGEEIYVAVKGGSLSSESYSVLFHNFTHIQEVPSPFGHQRVLAGPTTTGEITAILIRITATDSQPDLTADQLMDVTFQNRMSLSKQLRRCSFNQLRLSPTNYGVLDVSVNVPAEGNDHKVLVNAGYEAAKELVPEGTDTIRSLADLIMFVIPPGTGNWAAFATIPGKQSVFNNMYAGYLGALGHEIGHNLGLRHDFFDGKEYGGITGYMGGAVKEMYAPQRCYNGQNHWHLGWYATRSLEVDPFYPGLYRVAAFVDFLKTSSEDNVVIRVKDLELYLQYNRAKNFNQDTGMFPDCLTVIHNDPSRGTDLLAGLNMTNTAYSTQVHSQVLTIHVCRQVEGADSTPDFMEVSIGFGNSLCEDSPSLLNGAVMNDIVVHPSSPASSPAPTQSPVDEGTRFRGVAPTEKTNELSAEPRMTKQRVILITTSGLAVLSALCFLMIFCCHESADTTSKGTGDETDSSGSLDHSIGSPPLARLDSVKGLPTPQPKFKVHQTKAGFQPRNENEYEWSIPGFGAWSIEQKGK